MLALGAELPFVEPGLSAVAQVAVLPAQQPLRARLGRLQPVRGQFAVLVVGFAVGVRAALGHLRAEQQGRGGMGRSQGAQLLHAQLGEGKCAGLGLAAALQGQGDAGARDAGHAQAEAVGVRGAVEVAVPAQGAGEVQEKTSVHGYGWGRCGAPGWAKKRRLYAKAARLSSAKWHAGAAKNALY